MEKSGDVTEETPKNREGPNYSIADFTVKAVGPNLSLVTAVNEFFNSTQIKSELHWFTHRDTLERASERNDRRLLYIRPRETVIAALMVWCKSRVLEDDQAQIRLVAVDPAYRNYGLGAYLVSAAVDFAQFFGKKEMIADVAAEAPAVTFWEHCDFAKKSEYSTEGGRLMYRMWKPI
ncbi:GNAT family N-acetyltransferase [Halorubrum sp. SD683]|uniref:GNAT family N-acetyltransferase n=1 Tax=Halorubrum sp. SD683 TaxID=1855873 RepID=UPI000A2DD584|nr:GNAT family N-acetyltransferase [Halorubrum sp. SD683]OTF01889.1 hypothetical protein B9G49_01190 [Halorubrum sp. SD683]